MKKFCVLLAVFLSGALLYADQAAWITKEQAEKGAKLIKVSGVIRHYCAPCGETAYKSEKVSTVVVEEVESNFTGEVYYEVRVNGTGVDLAYVYVRSGGNWVNVAMFLGMDVSDVPELLPADVPEAKE